jgi:hypothetical protein
MRGENGTLHPNTGYNRHKNCGCLAERKGALRGRSARRREFAWSDSPEQEIPDP